MNDGIKYGKGLFETIKVVDKKPVYLEEHLARLENSMRFLGIDTHNLREKIKEQLSLTDMDVDCIRIMVLDDNQKFDLAITTRNTDYSDEKYNDGLKLKILEPLRDKNNPLIFHKTNNYLLNDFLHKEVQKQGFDEGVFLNQDDNVTEGTYTNIFFIKENEFITPPVEDGLLNGIYREKLIEFLVENGYEIKIESIKKSEIKNMDCCFVTNSLMEMRFVKQIDDVFFKKVELFDQVSEKIIRS